MGRNTGERRTPPCTVIETAANDPTAVWVAPDWRYDRIFVQIINMMQPERPRDGGSYIRSATKGKFEPSNLEEDDLGWGIIRLYRDRDETPGLYDDALVVKGAKGGRTKMEHLRSHGSPFQDEDCTTLCILAVPSYLTPSDFLGFVGEKTRDEVSHFRMIRTERSNRYMVLMKFRSGRKAREWRKEWNGKPFDDLEVCHSPDSCVGRRRS